MKSITKKITTEYHLHRTDGKDIPDEHVQELQDKAYDRINQMTSDGYTEGELCEVIGLYDIEYRGWWTVKKEN